MVNATINGKAVQVPENTTILEAAKLNNITIPHLCYLKHVNEIGACRVCVVEIEGQDRLVSSCNTIIQEGMNVLTNSPKARQARRINAELILSQHNARCAECVRSGNCELQKTANDMGINEFPYHEDLPAFKWNSDFPLIRDAQKCIKCMRCIQVCDNIQKMNVWDIAKSGSRTTVDVTGGKDITEAKCTVCGQCITHCPVGALTARDDTQKVRNAFAGKDKIMIASVAPAVRTSWGEPLGLTHEEASANRLATALRAVGFDYVFDTDFSADLTIMEEASEFVAKLKNAKNEKFPMFTSCCPGWVRFIKMEFPDLVPQLSSAKSPQQMFGAIIKSWYAQILGVEPDKIYHVSFMPCTAKKYECDVECMNSSGARDVDVVLTVRELGRLIKSEGINVKALDESEFDAPLGTASGAGHIFGTTGGVMEAALRTAYKLVTGQNPDPNAFRYVRDYDGFKEATFDIAGAKLKIAVAHGLGNIRKLCEDVQSGKVHYDFIECMACPTGCAGGGGQPIHEGEECGESRGRILLDMDRKMNLRFSHENPSIIQCYKEYLGEPLGEKSHHLLHTDQSKWELWK
ncbi:MAG: iron hydrogenase small subunit [Synergistaceae bacterium]|nr:iron hydrogenase small subunit [Synergistaceae bacterium]MBR0250608.1 iron hydrogenase small subunit [Synergistaceae bacterium]